VGSIITDQFLNGIHGYIRDALILADYKDFYELIQKARRVESNNLNKTKPIEIGATDI